MSDSAYKYVLEISENLLQSLNIPQELGDKYQIVKKEVMNKNQQISQQSPQDLLGVLDHELKNKLNFMEILNIICESKANDKGELLEENLQKLKLQTKHLVHSFSG